MNAPTRTQGVVAILIAVVGLVGALVLWASSAISGFFAIVVIGISIYVLVAGVKAAMRG